MMACIWGSAIYYKISNRALNSLRWPGDKYVIYIKHYRRTIDEEQCP